MNAIIRAYEATIDDVANDLRTVTAVVNTGAVDRYRSVIEPAGINLDAYRKNPTILWEHGKDPTRGRLPVGRALWIKRQGERLISRIQFAKDEYSQTLFEFYRDGVCRGWSIFALPDPKQASPPTRAEIRARPELADCEIMYRGCELGEVSAVAVPGNADTLTLMESRGIWFPAEARAGAIMPPKASAPGEEDDPENEAQHTEPDADDEGESRFIKKVGDEWGVFSEDGKLIAKHGTREGAVKQLAAIEAHKHDADRSAPELPAIPGRPYQDIDAQWMGEFRAMSTQLMTHIRDLADLMRGRV